MFAHYKIKNLGLGNNKLKTIYVNYMTVEEQLVVLYMVDYLFGFLMKILRYDCVFLNFYFWM